MGVLGLSSTSVKVLVPWEKEYKLSAWIHVMLFAERARVLEYG